MAAGRPGPQASHRESLLTEIGAAFRRRGWRLGVAESCTGGLVLKLLTDVPGSSDFVAGGVVAYADEVKESLLGVPGGILRSRGAVSEEAVLAMAEGARSRLGVEVGIGVTGIAGPGGAVPGKPVGTVWFGFASPSGTGSEHVRFPGGRAEVREAAADRALELLLRAAGG